MPDTVGIVLILAGALFVVGLVELNGTRRFARKCARARLAIVCIAGFVIGILGLINLGFVHTSKHTSATGVIVDLSQYHRKYSYSIFKVRGEDGGLLPVLCRYDYEKGLTPGEMVSVEALNYHSALFYLDYFDVPRGSDMPLQIIHLTVLDGRYAGWTLNEGDGVAGSEIAIGYGFLAAFAAWLRRRYIPKATDEPVTPPTG